MISMTIEGGAELERKLGAIESQTAKKIVRKAVREGLKPTHRAAKANAQSMVGGNMGALIAQNLQLRVMKKKRPNSYAMNVRPKPGVDEFVHIAKKSKYAGGRTFIPAAIEYGHDNVPAIPFMRQAADKTLRWAHLIVAKVLKQGIEVVAKSK